MTDACVVSCLQQSAEAGIPALTNGLMALGGGGFVGFLSGFAIKKVTKIIAIIVGLFLAAMMYAQHRGVIDVKWREIEETLRGTAESAANTTTEMVQNAAKDFNGGSGVFGSGDIMVPGTVGLVAGFLYGLKRG